MSKITVFKKIAELKSDKEAFSYVNGLNHNSDENEHYLFIDESFEEISDKVIAEVKYKKTFIKEEENHE